FRDEGLVFLAPIKDDLVADVIHALSFLRVTCPPRLEVAARGPRGNGLCRHLPENLPPVQDLPQGCPPQRLSQRVVGPPPGDDLVRAAQLPEEALHEALRLRPRRRDRAPCLQAVGYRGGVPEADGVIP